MAAVQRVSVDAVHTELGARAPEVLSDDTRDCATCALLVGRIFAHSLLWRLGSAGPTSRVCVGSRSPRSGIQPCVLRRAGGAAWKISDPPSPALDQGN